MKVNRAGRTRSVADEICLVVGASDVACGAGRRRRAAVTLGAAAAPPLQDQVIEFSADQVVYDSDADMVTASGDVRMNREGNYLAADQVVWNRKSGEVRAKGNVVVLTPQGDKLIGDNVL